MFLGVWVAALLAWPDLTFDAAWSSFGRIRPVAYERSYIRIWRQCSDRYILSRVQRTSRARLAGQFSPWFVIFGYNLFCVLAVSGYFMGVTQSKEYAEPNGMQTFCWYCLGRLLLLFTYARSQRRKEPHIYVANWYFMAFILVVAILHIVNNLALPISLG